MLSCNKYKIIWLGVCGLIIGVAFVHFTLQGINHIDPQIVLWRAQYTWREGKVIESIPQFAQAVWTAFDAGVRWSIAGVYINQMRDLNQGGYLNNALATCAKAVRILNRYDDEGSLSYDCTVIEEASKRLSPTLSIPTTRP